MKFIARPEASQQGGQATTEFFRKRMERKSGQVGISNGYVEWHIPELERVSVAEFERLLIEKFGPEYLQPISYRRVDGMLVPDVIEGER